MNVTWEKMYEELESYVYKNNTLFVKKGYITKDGEDLYEWLNSQIRKCYSNELSRKQKFALEKLGYVSYRNTHLKKLRHYIQQHGNQNIPEDFLTKDGVNYDEEGINLRKYKELLISKYVNNHMDRGLYIKLMSYGFKFELDDNQMYKILSIYKEINGTLNVPFEFETNDFVNPAKNGMYKVGRYKFLLTKKIVLNTMPTSLKIRLMLLGLPIPNVIGKIDETDLRELHRLHYERQIQNPILLMDEEKKIIFDYEKEYKKLKTKREIEYEQYWFHTYFEAKRLLSYFDNFDFPKIAKQEATKGCNEDVIIDDFVIDKSYLFKEDLYKIKAFLIENKEFFENNKLSQNKKELINTIYPDIQMMKKI